jgi:digeranylgeranylglycerophospholipid reductase
VSFTKVAIIGAGLSGMSCANELEKHGIIPTIYEKKSFIGDALDFQSILFNSFNFHILGDPIKHLSKKYDVNIKPQFKIKELINVSPNGKYHYVKGNLGYIVKRGTDSDSIENQLRQAINFPISFDTYVDIKDIINDYDRIVISSGTSTIAKEFNIFKTTFNTNTRIASIIGDFKTDSITVFWGRKYANNGYAYLVPYSAKSARLILIVNGITHRELDYYWGIFLKNENIKYIITETRDVEHNLGFIDPVQIGNLYFTGVAGGLIDDVFGFAAINAMVSGVCAARAILENKNYDEMVQPLKNDTKKLHELRTLINTWDNKSVDMMLTIRGLPIIKQYMYNNPFFKMTQISFLARISNNIWRKSKGGF